MSLGIKDIVYLITYVVTIISVFLSFRNRLANMEKEIKRSERIIYGDKGLLNLIDAKTCKEHRDNIYMAIRRSENVMTQAIKSIDELNKNVLTIMIYLKIRSPMEPNGKDDTDNLRLQKSIAD